MSLSDQQRQLLEALRKKKQQAATARSRPDRLPMSFTQLRAWYLDRMAPGAAHYLIPLAFRIEGPLDREALHRALNALVARHESLRTTFAMDEDGPYQIVADSLTVELADAADATPMDLTTGPLIRAHLLREGPERHVLHLTLHHIVADAWSLDVLRRELSALYDGRELPPLSQQYPDYAIRQRGRDHGEDLAYWRAALAGAPPVTELPADLPRPAVQTYAGAELPFSLDLPREEFRAYCRSLGATPYMVLLAAYLVVLSRRSGQRDLVVGTPVANRDEIESEGLIGFFTNTLAIRADLSGEPSFAEVVERVRDAVLDAHDHQGMPFERLVEELNPERRLDRSPVFQTMFNMLPEATAELELTGLTVTPVEIPDRTAKFDLTVGVRETLDGLVEYNTDLYHAGTISSLVADLRQVLAGAMDGDESPAATGAETAADTPRHEVARLVTRAWREALGTSSFGPEDNFFEVGGHSLLVLQVHERLRKRFSLTVTDLFRYPTVASLTAFLSPDGPARETATTTGAPPSGALAIVGMACRFPGATGPEEFWAAIRDGVEAVQDFTDEELLADGEDPALLADPAYVRSGTVLDGIDLFDAELFAFTPREAEILDPQQRLFLETAWEALEDAACDPDRVTGRIGVFAGSAMSTYYIENLLAAPDVLRAVGAYQVMLGNDKDSLPTRTSYKLDLRGPSVSVNTACSTSLVALHLARQSLIAGDCDVALAGAVRVNAWSRRGYLYQSGGIGSPDGHCRPFDAEAQGTIGAGGVGVVVLKRLEDALAAGDTIHAVVRGSAVNNDGTRKVGYTAPAVDGQAEVITAALAAAGVEPGTIGYIEAHGTGTALGDPIEIAALSQVFTGDRRIALGSVKSNIGHADAAAGMAGLIKTVMALKHRTLPPTVNFATPNPRIDFGAFHVPTTRAEWPAGDGPRRAGVSAFGMGGTNAHVVLEEAPEAPAPIPAPPAAGPHLLVLSAAGDAALAESATRLRAHLRAHPDLDLGDVATTLRHGRRRLRHRGFLVAEDHRSAQEAELVTGASQRREVAFLFPGQGAQRRGMGAGLYRSEEVFRATVDACSAVLEPYLGLDLRQALYGEAGDLDQTRLTQPALFVTEYALARTLMERGVRPAMMAGHSIGEYVAACLAGVFTLEDALRLVAARGRLVQSLPPGSMLAVPLPESEVAGLLGEDLSLAAVNTPETCVVAGPERAVAELERRLTRQGVACRALRTSHAFHSAMLDPVLDAFAAEVAAVRLGAPGLPYLSNVTGDWVSGAETKDPAYWVRHLRETVRFADCARVLVEADAAMVEAGPGRTLATLVRRQGGKAVIAPFTEPDGGRAALLEGVGRLWVNGADVDWAAFAPPGRRVPLPTYPFDRRRYWVEPRTRRFEVTAAAPAPLPVAAPLGEAAAQEADAVAAAWHDVLGIAPASPRDDFFDLGGDSLVATQLASRLGLPIEAIFDNPTLGGQRALVAAAAPAREVVPAVTAAPGAEIVPAAVATPVAGLAPAAASAPARETIPVVEDPGPAPVSFVQRRMWFIDQVHGSAAYAVATALDLRGELDTERLHDALRELVRRHESLRTVFRAPDGEPEQVVLPAGEVPLPVDDCDDAERALSEEAARPFDLARGPLFRARLLRLAPDHHVLSLAFHHIVVDGWTITLLRTELAALYNGRTLPEPAVRYRDYARWQREQAVDLGFWTEKLRGVPHSLDLPTDRPRPPMQTFEGAVATHALPAELAGGLRRLSQERGATLYMTLLAALHALLYRYSGQEDICVGSPVAGRTRPEFEDLAGCFINTLVMRATMDGDLPYTELLAQVRAYALGAYAHQDVTFERLVEELNPPRDLSRNPLFQVLFNLLNLPKSDLDMAGLTVAERAVETGTAQVDLVLYVYEQGDELLCRLEYNTALYDAGTARRLLRHYETLLSGIVATPTAPLSELALLTGEELAEQLDSQAVEVPDRCVHELVEAQADRTPDAVAVTFEGASMTYRELDERADRVARRLRAAGVGPETLVGVALERSATMLVTLLGVLKAGGAYVPLDPMYPRDRQDYIIDHSGIGVLVTERELADRYTGFQGELILTDQGFPEESPGRLPASATRDNLCYVLYTSGSTGRPKGVRVQHSSVVNFLTSMSREPGLTGEDTLLAVTTFAFDISVLELFLPLTVGGHVVIAGREAAYDPVRLAALLDDATVMQATPATWRLLLSAGWAGKPTLKALCGGEALPADLATDLRGRVAELWNMYGPTETTIWSTLTRVTDGPITIGQPIANTRIHLLDTAMNLVPTGVVGELYIGGDGLARDYLGQPELTAERFVTWRDGARLYRTGDLARRRADGSIEFLGRADGQVKVRGYRIELGEIESLLLAHPAVREAAVVVRGSDEDKSIAAYLVTDPGAEHDWRDHLRRKLPDYMIPSAFVPLDTLPLTPNGKVDRKALPEPVGQARAEGAAPRTPAEVRLVELWSAILGVQGIGIDDDFFAMGGDSFKAVRAVRDSGIQATVLDLFKHPTIRAFATLDGSSSRGGGLLHELTPPRTAATLTLVCVPFAGGGAITYQPLAAAMPEHVTMLALEPPGHDTGNPGEPVLPFHELVEGCVKEIKDRVEGPVALYGHCMGGALTTLLARRLEEEGVDLVKVVIGGHFPAPRLPGKAFAWMRKVFPMERWTSKRQALEFLRAMGFFTEALDPGERDFIMGVFLHDTQEGEDYYTELYKNPIEKLSAPLVCVVGENDRATELYEERYREWEAFSDSVSLEVIPKAGHYFQKHQAPELAEILTGADADVPAPAPAPAPAAPPAGRRQPSLKTFFLVAFGQLVSLVGTGLTTFGLGLWVYQQTQSITMFSIVSVMALLPAVVLAPIAGAVADRLDRRLVMITADSAAGCGSIALAALLWTGGLQLWHIYAIVAVGAVSTAFHQPAYMAAVAQLVPKRYYGRANGLAQLGQAAGTVLAPLLGGALMAVVGLRGIVVIDLSTFAFAVTVTLAVRFPDTLFKKREEPFWHEVTGGWRYISRRHGLLAIILFTSFLNFPFAMVEVLSTPLLLSLTDTRGLGLALSMSGVGLVVGSLIMTVTGGLARRTHGILGCFMALGVAFAIIGIAPNPVLPAIGLFLVGLLTALLNAHWFSIVQQKVGLDLQGRVIATNLMLSWAMVPVGFLLAGPLVEHVFNPIAGAAQGRGIGLLTIVAGAVTVLIGLAAFRYRPVRHLEDDLPDAIPDAVVITDKDEIQQQADKQLIA
ncbi:non-ribosomal peptide synthetase/type I polyketide synthase [Nonomuraea roseoviolacea]|uniref:Amino acid adenylation domain-containing protein n=1 Tax=Nonomuraea roseoviolacea subsp. carminata TaxID=160689 RepID=A0ABT1K8L5_9ACTN|nr:non-ribosomal peptide synthetase/type I polyketide synthase [Nonomuraea roseoviolacea]MCP2349354.1 amino acid adenylation domain-containing protein [Nonomuraea roseoviolacea subsp. carminata]